MFIWAQNLQTELEKTKVKYQELEKQKADAQSKLDELDKEVRMKDVFFSADVLCRDGRLKLAHLACGNPRYILERVQNDLFAVKNV